MIHEHSFGRNVYFLKSDLDLETHISKNSSENMKNDHIMKVLDATGAEIELNKGETLDIVQIPDKPYIIE
jgi:hypothetical protein